MWKITFFFAQFNFTWTETYYMSGSSSYSAVQSACVAVAQARVGLNSPQCSLQAIRVVLLTQPRASTFIPPGLYPSAGTFVYQPAADPDQDSAPQFVALQVKFYSQVGVVSRRYLSGIPEGVVGTKLSGRNLEPFGLLANAMNSFLLALTQYGWSWRYTNLANKQPCTQVTTSAQFPSEIGVQFNTQVVQPVPNGLPYIVLRGFRKVNYRLFGLGGVYPVDPNSPGLTAAAPPYAYYLQNTSQVSVSNIAQKGVGVQLAYSFAGFFASGGPVGTGYTILSANHRKRGVSALSLRGRSRSKP